MPKVVKLWMIEVGDDYEVRRNDGVLVGPMVQKWLVLSPNCGKSIYEDRRRPLLASQSI